MRKYVKILSYFFSNVGKTESVPEFEFERFYKIICGRLYTVDLYKVDTLESGHLFKTDSITRNGLLCFAVKKSL